MITTLSTVNDMLALLGEFPLNDLDTLHPVVPRALSTLDTTNTTVQGIRWWFNTEHLTLLPQVTTKYLLLPSSTLTVDSVSVSPRVAQRGNKLYNLDDGTFEFDDKMDVVLQRLVPYEDLPSNARAYVRARALQAFQNTIDGDATKTRELKEEVRDTYIALNAEHIRAQRVNMLARPGIAYTLNNIRGNRRTSRFI